MLLKKVCRRKWKELNNEHETTTRYTSSIFFRSFLSSFFHLTSFTKESWETEKMAFGELDRFVRFRWWTYPAHGSTLKTHWSYPSYPRSFLKTSLRIYQEASPYVRIVYLAIKLFYCSNSGASFLPSCIRLCCPTTIWKWKWKSSFK